MRIDIRKLEADEVFYIRGRLVRVWSRAKCVSGKWRIRVVDVVSRKKYMLASKTGFFLVFEDENYEEDMRLPGFYQNLMYSNIED